jgi:hypothetical protein
MPALWNKTAWSRARLINKPAGTRGNRQSFPKPGGKPAVWYVSYRLARATTMRVFKTRDRAIRAACHMLGGANGQDVKVGPMLETHEAVLDDRDLRRICAIVRGEPPPK